MTYNKFLLLRCGCD